MSESIQNVLLVVCVVFIALLTARNVLLSMELHLIRTRLQFLKDSNESQNEVNKAVQDLFKSHSRMIDLHWDYMRTMDQSGRIMHRQIEELQRTKAEKETW